MRVAALLGSAALAFSPVISAMAIAESNAGLELVARDAVPEAMPMAIAEANLFGNGCAFWNPACWLDITTYFVGSVSFSIYSQWGHACNMVKYGQSWQMYSDPVWGKSPSIGWQNMGAFAQSGFQLFAYANFNIGGGWYGSSKTKWLGFCNDLWNNHYKPQKDCSRDQWKNYCNKWGIKEGSSCNY